MGQAFVCASFYVAVRGITQLKNKKLPLWSREKHQPKNDHPRSEVINTSGVPVVVPKGRGNTVSQFMIIRLCMVKLHLGVIELYMLLIASMKRKPNGYLWLHTGSYSMQEQSPTLKRGDSVRFQPCSCSPPGCNDCANKAVRGSCIGQRGAADIIKAIIDNSQYLYGEIIY